MRLQEGVFILFGIGVMSTFASGREAFEEEDTLERVLGAEDKVDYKVDQRNSNQRVRRSNPTSSVSVNMTRITRGVPYSYQWHYQIPAGSPQLQMMPWKPMVYLHQHQPMLIPQPGLFQPPAGLVPLTQYGITHIPGPGDVSVSHHGVPSAGYPHTSPIDRHEGVPITQYGVQTGGFQYGDRPEVHRGHHSVNRPGVPIGFPEPGSPLGSPFGTQYGVPTGTPYGGSTGVPYGSSPGTHYRGPPLDHHGAPSVNQFGRPPVTQYEVSHHNVPPVSQHGLPPVTPHGLDSVIQHSGSSNTPPVPTSTPFAQHEVTPSLVTIGGNQGRHPSLYPAGSTPLDAQSRRDELIINSLYSKSRSPNPSAQPGSQEEPSDDDLRNLFKDTQHAGSSVTARTVSSGTPSDIPIPHHSSSTPAPSESVHIQKISPTSRVGKGFTTAASSSLPSDAPPSSSAKKSSHPLNYHAPEARISSFGHAIIHDKNE